MFGLLVIGSLCMLAHGLNYRPLPLNQGAVAGGGGYQPPEFALDGDRVFLRGCISWTTTPAGYQLATLPVGFRPPANVAFAAPAKGSTQSYRLDIQPDGAVKIADVASGNPKFVSIEAVFSISATGDAAAEGVFTAPTLVSGLRANGGDWQVPQCRKSVDNVVECRGLVRTNSGKLNGDMFVLPEGMRPANTHAFLTISHDSAANNVHLARVDVNSNGGVRCHKWASTSVYCGLDGIRFSLAAATPFTRVSGLANQDRGWTASGFVINRNTLLFQGLTRATSNIGTSQMGSLQDVALRPRYKRLFNTVSHNEEAPRFVEVRPDGGVFSINAPGSIYGSLDGVQYTLQPSQDFAPIPVQLFAPFTAKPSADGSVAPSYYTYTVTTPTGVIRRCRLQGDVVRANASAPGNQLLQLPGDLRVARNVAFVASSLLPDGTATFSRVDVNRDGIVELIAGEDPANATAVSLDNIDFAFDGTFTTLNASGYTDASAKWETAGYAKDSSGRVYLRGLLKSATAKPDGTIVLTLPEAARPVYTQTFAVNSHSTTADLFIRVDILPNGNVVAQQGFPVYVALDGISYETSNTSDWEPLLDTLPIAQQTAFVAAPGFAPPAYKVVENLVYFRGVVERKVSSNQDTDTVPVLGFLPQTTRPEKNVHFPTLALDGFKLHHLTVSGAGQVQVQFDVSQQYVALDGIAFARWSGDYAFSTWRFGTNNGDTMSVQLNGNGVITNAFSSDGLWHTGRNGPAPASFLHKAPYRTDAVVLGNWIIGPINSGHFSINHAASGTGLPQVLLRNDGNIFCRYAGAVGNRAGPLSSRAAALQVGNWLMGPVEDDADSFVISKLGTGEVIALMKKSGDVYLEEKVVTLSTLSTLGFSMDIGANNRDPDEYAPILSGSWAYGPYNDNAFVFNAGSRTTPSMVIASTGKVIFRQQNGRAPASFKHTGPSADVIQLGDFLIGMKDADHFVINTIGLEASVRPQFLSRWDGPIWAQGISGAAPAEWVLNGTEGSANVMRVGNWFMGQKDAGHFVINRVGASLPQFLLRSDGQIYIGSQDSPPPPSFFLAAPRCQVDDVPTYAAPFKDTRWTMAAKSGNVIISRAGAYAPSLVLGETMSTVKHNAVVLTGRQLAASDPNVLTVGDWLIGFHDDIFVICTIADKGSAKWPQFALDASGTMYGKEIVGPAGVEWSLNNTYTKIQMGDWHVATKDADHIVIVPLTANARGLAPPLLIRSDGTIYTHTPLPGIDQQQACHLDLQCDTGLYTSYDTAGEPACAVPTNCTAGSFVATESTPTSDRECQVCADGTYSTAVNQPSCTAWTECTLDATYETVTPTSTSDRECSDCLDCQGTFIVSACTLLANRECQCTPCDITKNETLNTSCSTTNDTVCEPCDVCDYETQYQTRACRADLQTACETLTICDPEAYETVAKTQTSDRECEPLTKCQVGQEVLDLPTATTDRSCRACPAGKTDDDLDASTPCITCGSGHYVQEGSQGSCNSLQCPAGFVDADSDPTTACAECDGRTSYTDVGGMSGTCLNMTECGAGEEVSVQGTATNNRECQACEPGQYSELGEPCVACTPSCKVDEYIFAACTLSADLDCRALEVCDAGFEQTVAPTLSSNRVCEPCKDNFYKAMSDNLTSVQPCLPVKVCKINQEFVVTPATPTSDTVCAPVASVFMYFSPAVELAEEDANATGLQDVIVALIVNRTELVESDILNVIPSGQRRRATQNTVSSAEVTFRNVVNQESVQAVVDEGFEIEYNGKTTQVQSVPVTTRAPATTQSTSKSASGGSSGATIGAGVGAGIAVVVVAVVVTMYYRRREVTKKKNADARGPVAFENPTYSEGDERHNPIYDDPDAEEEGMYSEMPIGGGEAATDNPFEEPVGDEERDGFGAFDYGDDDGDDGDDQAGYLDVDDNFGGFE
eukprot:m.248230 g.248230  ORF g.248230 m.248230 type:complete len:1914 (+) comp17499_c0_seq1:194-5935(+)